MLRVFLVVLADYVDDLIVVFLCVYLLEGDAVFPSLRLRVDLIYLKVRARAPTTSAVVFFVGVAVYFYRMPNRDKFLLIMERVTPLVYILFLLKLMLF